MSNRAIELHDSTAEDFLKESGNVIIRLSPAYIHQSDGEPGIDPGSGWLQKSALIIDSGEISGALPELPTDISSGEMVLDGVKSENLIPIPFSFSGNFRLHLTFMSGNKVVVTGTSANLELYGVPEYLEEFLGLRGQSDEGI